MSPIPLEHTSHYGWSRYNAAVADLIWAKDEPDIIEIGAGRSPLFTRDDLPANVASYTISDISQSELDRAPEGWTRACFDICGDVSPIRARYDVAFTRMLAEHVPDGPRFHANVFRLLKPGGVAFHFMPTLCSPPFVLNKLLPETLSRTVLSAFFRHRNEDEIPKFPARYSMCIGKCRPLIARYKSIGYGEVDIRTFYGHGYFESIPIVRDLDRALSNIAYRRGLTLLGSYAYVTLGKPAHGPAQA